MQSWPIAFHPQLVQDVTYPWYRFLAIWKNCGLGGMCALLAGAERFSRAENICAFRRVLGLYKANLAGQRDLFPWRPRLQRLALLREWLVIRVNYSRILYCLYHICSLFHWYYFTILCQNSNVGKANCSELKCKTTNSHCLYPSK